MSAVYRFYENLTSKIWFILKSRVNHSYSPYSVIHVSPEDIRYITPPGPVVDFTQFGRNRDHPHAALDRGHFAEVKRIGTVVAGEWDRPKIPFETLLEYQSLRDYISGRCDWNETEFAKRAVNYVASGGKTRNYSTVESYLQGRKKEIDELIGSIKRHGVMRVSKHPFSSRFPDEISVNVSRDGELLFNNRGHHRVSIAKILGVQSIPVAIIVRHEKWVKSNGYNLNTKQKLSLTQILRSDK